MPLVRYLTDLIAALAAPRLPLRTEAQWRVYFEEKVVPLRRKLLETKLSDIRAGERYRALFVLKYEDAFSFIEAISAYTDYAVQHLCSYIDREASAPA